MGTIYQFGWAVGMGAIGVFAYYCKEWRYLVLFTSVTPAIWIPVLWFIPESPIWLVANGKIKKAEKFLKRAARLNRVSAVDQSVFKIEAETLTIDTDQPSPKLDSNKFTIQSNQEDNVTKYTVLDLFRHKHLFIHLTIMALLWFTNNAVYYSLLYSTPSLDGNRFINYALSVLVEIPAYLIASLAVVM